LRTLSENSYSKQIQRSCFEIIIYLVFHSLNSLRISMRKGILILSGSFILLLLLCHCKRPETVPLKPNILLVITDDQSWEHAGSYGDRAVRTPSIDRLSREGIRFENAYTACPSCSPSRAAILTGQDIYRLEEGGVLTGFIRDTFVLFPQILAENGSPGWITAPLSTPSWRTGRTKIPFSSGWEQESLICPMIRTVE
jgi:hypothetical protein